MVKSLIVGICEFVSDVWSVLSDSCCVGYADYLLSERSHLDYYYSTQFVMLLSSFYVVP